MPSSGALSETGGEYRFLSRAYGPHLIRVAWCACRHPDRRDRGGRLRLWRLCAAILPLGAKGGAIYAALGVIALTGINLAGLRRARRCRVMGALLVIALQRSRSSAARARAAAADARSRNDLGLA
jgi:hypothetical protein